jgi:hypothetical protein
LAHSSSNEIPPLAAATTGVAASCTPPTTISITDSAAYSTTHNVAVTAVSRVDDVIGRAASTAK